MANALHGVDGKNRELIGNFENAGTEWDRSPVPVNDRDFRSDASGVGISYGIYDPPNNRGAVCAGISHGTPGLRRPFHRQLGGTAKDFAATAVLPNCWFGGLRWRQRLRLMGLEDRNPSSVVQRIWHRGYRRSLPHGRFQMESHRASSLFRISKHWAAEPLVSCEKMLGFIRNTSTKTGLIVTEHLDRAEYPAGSNRIANSSQRSLLNPAKYFLNGLRHCSQSVPRRR